MRPTFSPNPDHPDSIDLRSDTVTQPTEAMLEAMSKAPLGDDVLGDEPTVMELERRHAELLGRDAAMFVPTGTMANLSSALSLTQPGDAVIIETRNHVYQYESGGLSGVGGVVFLPLQGERGFLSPETLKANICQENVHKAWTTLLWLENTHNTAGGTCIPFERFETLCDIAREEGMKIHLDGARLWNASVATGIPLAKFAAKVDTVSCCFSKGLSAPVGSIVCGSEETIALARKKRKMLGGGMRQAGVLAAAALVALDTTIDRLAEDHARIRTLAEHIANLPGYRVDLRTVETNILMVDVAEFGVPAVQVVERLAEHRVRCLPTKPTAFRLVSNRHFTDEKLERAKQAFCAVKPDTR